MHSKMNVQNSPVFTIAKSTMLDQHRNNFKDAVTYMSQTVTEIFPDAILSSNTTRKRRSVNESNSGGRERGRGRFGDGRGGRECGRDGRGQGRHSQYRPGPGMSMNGVDVSDVTRMFTTEEMDKLGSAGQRYIYEQWDQLRADRGGCGFHGGARTW